MNDMHSNVSSPNPCGVGLGIDLVDGEVVEMLVLDVAGLGQLAVFSVETPQVILVGWPRRACASRGTS